MFLRFLPSLSASLVLLCFTGCREQKITTYRVPKENPPAVSPHDDMETADTTAPASPAADVGPLTWQAPSSWIAKPLGAMRKGSFLVKEDDGTEADVSIISFPGAAGGLAENLNRWRGQVKLPPLSAEELSNASTELSVNNLKFTVVDFSGQGSTGPTRILGAVLSLGDETYFFKLIGPAALAEKARPDFIAFLKTVKNR
ncbi:MAG TPA: hypothetical protein VL357_01090 [Rariglobus sp.]|jgi:hypothetical protein|nr:hypothetical protein [Rariglobus sp.]